MNDPIFSEFGEWGSSEEKEDTFEGMNDDPLFRGWSISIVSKLGYFLEIIFISKILGLSVLESV